MGIASVRDDFQVRGSARYDYACSGNNDERVFFRSPTCSRRIARGSTYVVKVELATFERATPRLYLDTARFCVHCALAFIPQIVVTGEAN